MKRRREVENINNLEPAIYGFLTIIALLLGLLLGYILRKYLAEARIASAEEAHFQ
jgi:ribonuclease Y